MNTNTQQIVLVACRISASAFSGERVVRIKVDDRGCHYIVTAPTGYCYRDKDTLLGEGEPPKGESIDGLVAGLLLERDGGRAKVEIAGGEVLNLDVRQIPYRVRAVRAVEPFG